MYYRLTYENNNIYIKKIFSFIILFSNLELGVWNKKRNKSVLFSNVPINYDRLQKYLREVK